MHRLVLFLIAKYIYTLALAHVHLNHDMSLSYTRYFSSPIVPNN